MLSIPIAQWKELIDQFHIDPYLVWSDITKYREFTQGNRELKTLAFLIELTRPYDPNANDLAVPALFSDTLNGTDRSCFVTARIKVPAGPDASSPIPDLLKNKAVVRAQLGFPVTAQDKNTASPLSSIDLAFKPKLDVICGLLDDGCAFAHEQFRIPDQPMTRVVALWDQTPIDDEHAATSSTVPYGREFASATFNQKICEHWLGDEVAEGACYREIFRDELHGLDTSRTHGTAVMDLLGGRLPPRRCPHVPVRPEDLSDSPIVFVQFPVAESRVSNGRWLATHVVEGLYYLFDVANRLIDLDGTERRYQRKICVTLSYGALAGPHNRSGMLPRALEEIARLRGNLGIVLAAGNSRRARCHSTRSELKPTECHSVSLIIPPVKPFETYVEMWVDDPGNVSVRVTAPSGSSRCVCSGDIEVWRECDFSSDASDEIVAALVFCRKVVQGEHKTMILLATAKTEVTRTGICAPAGAWSILVTNIGNVPTALDLWIERDDLRESHPAQFAHFDRQDNDDGDNETCANPSNDFVTPNDTLASVAGGNFAHPVGGYANVVSKDSLCVTVANYSGQGSDETEPFLYACTDEGFATPGIRVAGTRSNSYTRMSGTSVAAPQAARALAAAMNAQTGPLTAQDIQVLFERLACNTSGLYRYDQVAGAPEGQGPLIVIL